MPSSETFTLMQLNAWQGRLYYPLRGLLDRVRPDILAAQEMLTGAVELTPSFLTAEELAKTGGFSHTSCGGRVPVLGMKGHEFDGCCVTFSRDRFACLQERAMPLYHSGTASSHEDGLARYYGLLHTELTLDNGAAVHVLNHHGRVVYDGRAGNPVSDFNFRSIAAYIEQLAGPVIVCGDFNLYRTATSLQPLRDLGLVNLNDVYNIDTARNINAWRPEDCVSHVFVSPHIAVEDYAVMPDVVSDHSALVLTARIAQ